MFAAIFLAERKIKLEGFIGTVTSTDSLSDILISAALSENILV